LGVVRPIADQFQSVGVDNAGLVGLGKCCWNMGGKFGVGRLGEYMTGGIESVKWGFGIGRN
jgi:hypothetical protein